MNEHTEALPDQFPNAGRPADPTGRMPTAWHVANLAAALTDLERKLIREVDQPPSSRFQQHHCHQLSNEIAGQRDLLGGLVRVAVDQGTTVREMIGELSERHGVPDTVAAHALTGYITPAELDDPITTHTVDKISAHLTAASTQELLTRARTALTQQQASDTSSPGHQDLGDTTDRDLTL